MMHTELYCPKLSVIDPVQTIRAVHAAWLQLHAIGVRVDTGDGAVYDNAPSLDALAKVLHSAGHPGF